MPDETRNYLPQAAGARRTSSAIPRSTALELGDIPDAPYFAVVKMDRKIDVKVAAQLAEMPVDEFQYLNPQHNRPVIAGADDYTILLPIDKAELFAAKLAAHRPAARLVAGVSDEERRDARSRSPRNSACRSRRCGR